jgi:hypothetical protein
MLGLTFALVAAQPKIKPKVVGVDIKSEIIGILNDFHLTW